MNRTLKPFLAIMLLLLVPLAVHASSLQGDVDQATAIIERFKDMPEKGIPREVLRDAKGLAIMTVTKAGFVFSGRGGTGVVIARTGKGWSGPSGLGTGGAGFGFQAGVQVAELVFVLNTPEAVAAFSRGGNVTIGGELSAAAGPVGRNLEAAVTPMAAIYTYSRTQGLFGGISIEGTVLVTRKNDNRKYYGRKVSAKEILSRKVDPPKGARKLIHALESY